jgi:integrase
VILRDPRSPGWPNDGERTNDEEVAAKWAWAYVEMFRDKHRAKALGLPSKKPLGDTVTAWLKHRERTVEPATVANDRSALNHLLEHLGQSKRVGRIRTEDYQSLADSMLDRGYRVGSVRSYMIQLASFAKWAGTGPCDVDLPNRGTTDVWAPDEDERALLREAADKVDQQRREDSVSARLLVEVGLNMGLRRGELIPLRWEDIDEQERTARVNWQVTKGSGSPKPLKGKQARTVLILPDWWAWHRRDATGLVLHSKGKMVRQRTIQTVIERVLDQAGLNAMGRGAHAMRHSFSREFIERGGHLDELSESLGHSSVLVTQRSYGRFMKQVAHTLARRKIYGHS